MGEITFIFGGARSGKSSRAVQLARECRGKIAFIATGQALDKEMRERILLHRKSRPKHWQTFEEPEDPAKLIQKIRGRFDLVIVDCLTLLVSNLILRGLSQAVILARVRKMLSGLKKGKGRAIIVSNEVGLGIVPENKLARDFRDIAGRVNQLAAEESTEVLVMFAGMCLKLKPQSGGSNE